jgi:hypothetical protein
MLVELTHIPYTNGHNTRVSSEEALRLWLQRDSTHPKIREKRTAVIKNGPEAFKAAELLTIGPPGSDVVKQRTLRLRTLVRSAGDDFEEKQAGRYTWYCEGEEIELLRALLTEDLPVPGGYTLINNQSPAAAVARLLAGEDAATAADAVARLLTIPGVREALAHSDTAAAGAALVTAQRQRQALELLEKRVLDPSSLEATLHDALKEQWWLFGGRYLGEHRRRLLTVLDQVDIPLIRADGSLHIVELKRAKTSAKLIYQEHGHLAVGTDVHKAVSQGINYLRSFDEHQAQIRQDLKVDVRRTTVTVVIGHPAFCDYDEEDVAQTLRTYNSHLARIEVITYAELIAGARAALDLTVPEIEAQLRPNEIIIPDPQRPASVTLPAASSRSGASTDRQAPMPLQQAARDDPWATGSSDDPWATDPF